MYNLTLSDQLSDQELRIQQHYAINCNKTQETPGVQKHFTDSIYIIYSIYKELCFAQELISVQIIQQGLKIKYKRKSLCRKFTQGSALSQM